MSEWEFAQANEEQQLAKMHYFSMVKQQEGNEVEFTITVKEYLTPKDPAMAYFAQADKQTNQKTAPYRPIGWGTTLMVALAECIRAVQKFPYQG